MSRSIRMTVVSVVFVVAVALAPLALVSAQDAGQGTLTNCDSTLMTLVLLAQQGFGYQSPLDINTFERGQFGSYFDEFAAMQAGQAGQQGQAGGDAGQTGGQTGGDAGQTGGQAGGDAGQTGGDAGQTGGAASGDAGQTGGDAGQTGGQTGGSGVTLATGGVANEDPRCSELRTDVENFITAQLQGGMRLNMAGIGGQMGDTAMGDQGGQGGQQGGQGGDQGTGTGQG
jgi:hypothetical protein